MKRPRKEGWYRFTPIEGTRTPMPGVVIGYVFRGAFDGRWNFYGTCPYVMPDGARDGNSCSHFSMLLSSFVGRGEFQAVS